MRIPESDRPAADAEWNSRPVSSGSSDQPLAAIEMALQSINTAADLLILSDSQTAK